MTHSDRRSCLAAILACGITLAGPAWVAASAQEPVPLEQAPSCHLALSTPGVVHYRGSYSRGYDAGNEAPHAERAEINVLSEASGCAYALVVEPEGGASQMTFSDQVLEFSIRALGSSEQRTINEVMLRGRTQGGRLSTGQQIEVLVQPGQDVLAGLYRGFLKVSLFDETDGKTELVDQQSLEVIAEVQPRVSASFGIDPAAKQTKSVVDFGVLENGTSKQIDFSVSANTGYDIRLSSLNDGRLRHKRADAAIEYNVLLDGAPVTLKDVAGSVAPLTGTDVSHHNLEFVIPSSPSQWVSGSYSDELTVVITAN